MLPRWGAAMEAVEVNLLETTEAILGAKTLATTMMVEAMGALVETEVAAGEVQGRQGLDSAASVALGMALKLV